MFEIHQCWNNFCHLFANTLQPPQMGSMGMMNPPTMMYSQPVMRPPNPFGSVSSAQVGAQMSDCSSKLMRNEVSSYLCSYRVE